MNRVGLVFGLAFGGLIAGGRLNEYQIIHGGLRFQNLYMYEVMCSAVAVALPLLWLLRRRGWATPLGGALTLPSRRIERKHVYGGLVFGAGWAIAGTCPAPALAMVGAGGVLGLFVVLGMFAGIMLRDWTANRATLSMPVEHGQSPGGSQLVRPRRQAGAFPDF